MSQTLEALSNAAVYAFTLPFDREKTDLSIAEAFTHEHGQAGYITDGTTTPAGPAKPATTSGYVDYSSAAIKGVRLNWEQAYARVCKYRFDDAQHWRDAQYTANYGREGVQEINY